MATATAEALTWRERLFRWGPALRNPAFRLLWLSLLPGTLGMMMAVVAFGYVAYQLSGSTTALAVVNVGWGVPMVLLSPFAGVVADRFSRRTVLLVTQAVVGLTAVAACLLVTSGSVQVWQLMAVTFAQGTAFAFNMPARQALIAELVGPVDLPNALAINNAGLNFNRVAGPAIAGALLTLPAVGPGGVFALMAALYVVVLLALWRLPDSGKSGAQAAGAEGAGGGPGSRDAAGAGSPRRHGPARGRLELHLRPGRPAPAAPAGLPAPALRDALPGPDAGGRRGGVPGGGGGTGGAAHGQRAGGPGGLPGGGRD